MKRKCC